MQKIRVLEAAANEAAEAVAWYEREQPAYDYRLGGFEALPVLFFPL